MQQAASSKNSLFKTSSSLDSIEASGNCVTSQGPSANLVLSKSCPLFFSLQAFSFHGNVAFVVALGSELRRINLAVDTMEVGLLKAHLQRGSTRPGGQDCREEIGNHGQRGA